MANPDEQLNAVLVLVQQLLRTTVDPSAITPAIIDEKLDDVFKLLPQYRDSIDRKTVIDELIRRFSVWIGGDATLKSDDGHQAWLTAERQRDWKYWHRYRQWLEERLPWTAVDAVNQSVDSILGLLEDPVRPDTWTRRGLVVGHVQSGKTANYTGLICKAADAGYKIIIVLAGLHNNLRAQTQSRLEEGFLGYDNSLAAVGLHPVGVGLIDSDPHIKPNSGTTRANNGDFNTRFAKNLAVTPEERPWLFVVKKNKSVLKSLLKWIQHHVADSGFPASAAGAPGVQELPLVRKRATKLPLLIVDDEADNASVDTQELETGADGQPDADHQPTVINRLIRRIMHSFSRSAYVGYTATPFANIFIHERAETREEGSDLFPASFIINIGAPSNYIGPVRVFGTPGPDGRSGGLDLLRVVDDHENADGETGWMPSRHRNGHQPLYLGEDRLPPSVITAIDAFVLACAARVVRGQGREHASMLIHVTRFKSVQDAVVRQVRTHMQQLRQRLQRRIDHEGMIHRMRALWESDFLPTHDGVSESLSEQDRLPLPSWDDIIAVLSDTVADINVRLINGTAKDALDYMDQSATGLKVIAVGGDKLSRGLTLEGLCVSYFLRASRMYDTLMQMGRWFGYRNGYLDLCRLYTTPDLIEWFEHITDAGEELREEFDQMAAAGATPREYGLRVQSHPVLLVTSPLKMRNAKDLRLSFSGDLAETVSFCNGRDELESNLEATRQLLIAMGPPHRRAPEQQRPDGVQKWPGAFLWSGIPAEPVIEFLRGYKTHEQAYRVNSKVLAQFVSDMSRTRELTSWTVAMLGTVNGKQYELTPDIQVGMVKRAGRPGYTDRYAIGRLLDPKDEAIDLDEAAWRAALAKTSKPSGKNDPARPRPEPGMPNGPSIRHIRGFGADGVPPARERGVLLIYPLNPATDDNGAGPGVILPANSPPVIAFGVSFPKSEAGVKVTYKVTPLYWEDQYAAAE